jgi:16S rRNA processing protein RimM
MKKEECFFLGIISKKHGYKGDVNIKLDVNTSEKYKELDYLFIDFNGNLIPFFISSLRFKNNNIALVKFEDVNDEESANSLIGKSTYLPIDLLEEDEKLLQGLIHFQVIDRNHGELGKVISIKENHLQDLMVIDFKGTELLIPFVENYIKFIDNKKKEIHLHTPDGLIELYL